MSSSLSLPSGVYPNFYRIVPRTTLNRLYALHSASGGMGAASITRAMKRYDQLVEQVRVSGGDYDDLGDLISEDPELMRAMTALAWLVRTDAGETVTWEQAGDFAPGQFRIIAGAPEAAPPVTPTTTPATGSDPAGG